MASSSPDRIDVIFAGGDSLYHRWYLGGSWHPSASHYSKRVTVLTLEEPVAVPWGPNTVYVFIIGSDGSLKYKTLTTSDWNNDDDAIYRTKWTPDDSGSCCESLGGNWPEKPSVIAQYPYSLHVVARSHDLTYVYKRFNGETKKWDQSWVKLGDAKFLHAPTLTAWEGRFDLFGVAVGGNVLHKSWTAGSWSEGPEGGYQNIGGTFTNRLAAISLRPNNIHLFGVGVSGYVFHSYFRGDGKNFSDWDTHNSVRGFGVPVGVTWGASRFDVFWLGQDRCVYHYWNDEKGYHGPDNIGGPAVGKQVTAVSRDAGKLDVFYLGFDGQIYHNSYDQQSGWANFRSLSNVVGARYGVASSS